MTGSGAGATMFPYVGAIARPTSFLLALIIVPFFLLLGNAVTPRVFSLGRYGDPPFFRLRTDGPGVSGGLPSVLV